MVKNVAHIFLVFIFSFGLSLFSKSFTGVYLLSDESNKFLSVNIGSILQWEDQRKEALPFRIIELERNQYLVTIKIKGVTQCLGISAHGEVQIVGFGYNCERFELQKTTDSKVLFKKFGEDLFLIPKAGKTVAIVTGGSQQAKAFSLIPHNYIADDKYAYELQHLHRYYIKSSDGRYVYQDPQRGFELSTEGKTMFKVIFLPENKLALRHENKFLGVGDKFFTFSVEWRSGWEQFELLQNASNKFILRTAHNTYLSANVETGGMAITPNIPRESQWLAFHEVLDQETREPLIAQAEDDQEEPLSNYRRAAVLAQQIDHQLIKDEPIGQGELGGVYLVRSPTGEKRVIKLPRNPRLTSNEQDSLKKTYYNDAIGTLKLLANGVAVAQIIKVLTDDAYLKEYIQGPVLAKVHKERALELEHDVNLMRTKILDLFSYLIDKKLYVGDLHGENIIWQEGEPESSMKNHRWVIIDFGEVVENYGNDRKQLAQQYIDRLNDQFCKESCTKFIIEPLMRKYIK